MIAEIIVGILGFGGISLGIALAVSDISLLNYFIIIGFYCLNLLILSFIINEWRRQNKEKGGKIKWKKNLI